MSIRPLLALAPVIPILTIEKVEHAVPLAQALATGGLRVLEVMLRTPAGLPAVEAMRKAVPAAVIGVGTLTRAEDFAAAANAGAQFGASPGLTEEIAQAAKTAALPLLPGIMTPSELIAGLGWGLTTFALFPAQRAGGIDMLETLAESFPDVMFCPTGGVTRASAPDFLSLPNVICVAGSWVAPADRVLAGDWRTIEDLARNAAALARSK